MSDFRECATAVTYHSDTSKFLLVQRAEHDSNPGKWEFPGGGIDGEEPSKAVLRELFEEAGLEGEIIGTGDSKIVEFYGIKFRWHPFLVEVESRQVDLSDEHQRYEWVGVEEIEEFETLDGIIEDLENLGVIDE